MAKNKKKKGPNLGSDFEEHRKKVGKTLYSKGKNAISPSREAVRKEIREIVGEARQKDEMKRKASHVAENGIKDLKIDENRLLNFLKDIKVKECPSQYGESHQLHDIQLEPVELHTKRTKTLSYYDIWYNLICTEVKTMVSKKETSHSITDMDSYKEEEL